MRLTFSTDGGRVESVEVDPKESLENIGALLEVELGVPLASQMLMLNGANLMGDAANLLRSLEELGVKEDDMIYVTTAPTATAATEGGRGRGGGGGRRRPGQFTGLGPAAKRAHVDPEVYSSISWDDLPPNIAPDTLHAILQVNPGMMDQVRHDVELHTAASQPTSVALRTLMMKRNMQRALPELDRAAKLATLEARLAANPYDLEAQTELERIIADKNITENYETAMEHMPESFARVNMLYIQAKINGVPVKVFVDSGAQSTILSKRCAEHCGILRLVDEKFAGTAVGVGSARIIGRVHMAPLVIGERHFPCTFTVLDQNDMDCLLGLDMLKRYQSCIDLHLNVLRLKLGSIDVEIPFLGEADIPRGILGGSGDREPHGGAGATASSDTTGSGSGSSAGTSATSSASGTITTATPSPALPPTATPQSGPAASLPTRSPAVGHTTQSAPNNNFMAPLDLSAFLPPGSCSTTGTRRSSAGTSATASVGGSSGTGTTHTATSTASTTSTTRAQAAAPAAPPRVDEASIVVLMGMGFSREKCMQALMLANGNVDAAASLLPDI